MNRPALLLLLLPASLLAAPSTPPTLEEMFPRRARVFAETPGIARLPLPPAVLEQVRPDLSDVRLLDETGRERYPALQRRILDLHPYSVPEILAFVLEHTEGEVRVP